MNFLRDIYNEINSFAPFDLQEDYDNSGLILGSEFKEVYKCLICLDITDDIAGEAVDGDYDLIISHHPLIFHSIKKINSNSMVGKLLKNDISVIAAHTNYDKAETGMNYVLCEKLGFAPIEPLKDDEGNSCGYICDLNGEMSAKDFLKHIKEKLNLPMLRYNCVDDDIYRIAICGGSGGNYWECALLQDANFLITGDVKHDVYVDAQNASMTIIDAGHYNTEKFFCEDMRDRLSWRFDNVDFVIAENEKDILKYL